jgi:heme-degrading monooxygenase HmoA
MEGSGRSMSRWVGLAGLLIALLSSCVISQQHGTVTIATTTADSLKPGDLAKFGVAFVTPSTVTGQEQDRPALCLIFSQILEELRPSTRVVPLTETLSSINRAGLAEDYKRMMANYFGGELLDRASLAQVSKATGVRYVAQLKMASFQQESQDRFGVFGLRLVETKKANLRLSLQIWNSEDGSVAWEGTDEMYLANETMKENPISFRSVVEASARSLIAKLP